MGAVTTAQQFAKAEAALLHAYGARPVSTTFDVDGPAAHVHFLDQGTGDSLLLLHGGNGYAATWAPLIGPLAHLGRVLAPDRPGSGLTGPFDYRNVDIRAHAVEFVASFLDAVGVDRAAVIGNSMGAYFGLAFACAHPERVTGFAAVGATPMLASPMPLPHRILSIPGLNQLVWRRVVAADRLPTALYAHPDRLDPAVHAASSAQARLPWAAPSWLSLVRDVGSVRGFKSRHSLLSEAGRLDLPTLFVQGNRDPYGALADTRRLVGQMPQARLVVVDDAAHVPWYDNHAAVLAALTTFLTEGV